MDHIELGKMGETMAKALLEKKGYRILETNWHFGKFEIDIIARQGKLLIIVEVKTRQTDAFGMPESFLSRKQQNNLAESVEAYIRQFPDNALEIRYDIISVLLNSKKQIIRHFEDAFWPDNLGIFSRD